MVSRPLHRHCALSVSVFGGWLSLSAVYSRSANERGERAAGEVTEAKGILF